MWPRSEKPKRNALLARFTGGRLARDQKGTTMIEFGLLALPFFAIVGAILETSYVFLASNVLDGALEHSTRLLRTGQAQGATPNPYTIVEYRDAICERTFGMFDCSQLKIRVNTIATFSAASAPFPIDPDDGTWVATEVYSPGSSSEIVIAEVYYKWPTFINFFSFDLSNTADGHRLLGAVRTFKNEPF